MQCNLSLLSVLTMTVGAVNLKKTAGIRIRQLARRTIKPNHAENKRQRHQEALLSTQCIPINKKGGVRQILAYPKFYPDKTSRGTPVLGIPINLVNTFVSYSALMERKESDNVTKTGFNPQSEELVRL